MIMGEWHVQVVSDNRVMNMMLLKYNKSFKGTKNVVLYILRRNQTIKL